MLGAEVDELAALLSLVCPGGVIYPTHLLGLRARQLRPLFGTYLLMGS